MQLHYLLILFEAWFILPFLKNEDKYSTHLTGPILTIKWIDLRYTLKEGSVEFPDGLFSLSIWKDGVGIDWGGKDTGRAD